MNANSNSFVVDVVNAGLAIVKLADEPSRDAATSVTIAASADVTSSINRRTITAKHATERTLFALALVPRSLWIAVKSNWNLGAVKGASKTSDLLIKKRVWGGDAFISPIAISCSSSQAIAE